MGARDTWVPGIHGCPGYMGARDTWVPGIHGCPEYMGARDTWVPGIHGCPGYMGARDTWVFYNVLQVTIKRGLQTNNITRSNTSQRLWQSIKEANSTPPEAIQIKTSRSVNL